MSKNLIKSSNLALLAIFLSFSGALILVQGQALPPVVLKPTTALSRNNQTIKLSYANLSICAQGDKLSSTYCSCSEKVSSCDFFGYPGSMDNVRVK